MTKPHAKATPDFVGSLAPQDVAYAMFMERVKLRTAINENGCWIWQGQKKDRRYTQITFQNKRWMVHRLVYTIVKGPITKPLVVFHTCDNGFCCNPDHLWLGTEKENMQDAGRKRRWPRQFNDTCKNGHPRTPENAVRYGKLQKLSCRACGLLKERRKLGWPEDLAHSLPKTPAWQFPVNGQGGKLRAATTKGDG